MGNMFQDLPWLGETMVNTKHYIWHDIRVTYDRMSENKVPYFIATK
jgi:hypothetical protein